MAAGLSPKHGRLFSSEKERQYYFSNLQYFRDELEQLDIPEWLEKPDTLPETPKPVRLFSTADNVDRAGVPIKEIHWSYRFCLPYIGLGIVLAIIAKLVS